MAKLSPEMKQIQDRCVVDVDEFDAWLGERGYAWQPMVNGDYGFTLEQAQLRFICEDPVKWCYGFMTEPDTGDPYAFWDYQQPSVRAFDQDVVHQDGAEVGKTREIIALIMWCQCTGMGFTVKNPSILVTAPQQTHLNEIIRDIELHVGVGKGASGNDKPLVNRFWREPKKHPHYEMAFKGPTCTRNQLGYVHFRPFGHDGEALRGVHVNALAFADEAAKVKSQKAWDEFPRAQKPGCMQRIYSVPDGDNTTYYYKLTQQAIPNLPKEQPGFRLFHWPKTHMPKPFWSEERDKEFQRRWGGKDTPGYQRNVLGLHGQQENPVWPFELLESNIRDIPEYRAIKLNIDESANVLHVEVFAVDLSLNDGKKHGQERSVMDVEDDLTPYTDPATRREAIRDLLRNVLDTKAGGLLWLGADLGFAKDPTEILLSQQVGNELRDIVRIHAKGVSYDLQCELIYVLDEIYGRSAAGLGVDFGSAGTAVVQMLTNLEIYQDADYQSRMTGFMFAGAVDAIDWDGNVLEQEDSKGDLKAIRLPAKELATNLMTSKFQNRNWSMPYDTEVVGHFSNHTAREGARNRIFSKDNDHTIDAKRAMTLRIVFNEQIGVADVFSSGVHRREVA